MRLLITIGPRDDLLGNCYYRGLLKAGLDVHPIMLSTNAQRPSFLSSATRRLLGNAVFKVDNARLLKEVARRQADAFWAFKGMEILPQTLVALRERGVLLINYNADHPLDHFGRGSGNDNVIRGVPHYDLHLTYSQRIAADLAAVVGAHRVGVVPFGHDVDDATYAGLGPSEDIPRACFIGNPDSHRRAAIQALLAADLPVDVYGYDWAHHLPEHPRLTVHGPAEGPDYNLALRRYRLQLNLLRPHNAASHNMRSFEAPAVGAIMLAEDTPEHRAFFQEGGEAIYFASADEMVARARQLLDLSPDEAEGIRQNARHRSQSGGYHYDSRSLQALTHIQAAKRRAMSPSTGAAREKVGS